MFSTIGYLICVPFAWLLRLFYAITSSYGVSILLFTLVIKLVLLPFQLKSKQSMMRMSRMSGKMQEIQKKYANNQAKANEEIQKLYEEEGVNPMSGCLWSFLPLPIMIALYSIIRQPVTRFMMLSDTVLQDLVTKLTDAGADMSTILFYRNGEAVLTDGVPQLAANGQIVLVKTIAEQFPHLADGIDGWINVNYNFLGLDLAANPGSVLRPFVPTWAAIGLILIPILAGVSQFLLTRVTMSQQPQQDGAAASTSKSMMYTMPLFSVFLAFTFPAAVGLYWIAQSAFQCLQEAFLGKFFMKRLQEEEDARQAARDADRKRRMEEGRVQQEQRKAQQEDKPKLKQRQKAAQEAKSARAGRQTTNEEGRIGDRPYARGRSYQADRYDAL